MSARKGSTQHCARLDQRTLALMALIQGAYVVKSVQWADLRLLQAQIPQTHTMWMKRTVRVLMEKPTKQRKHDCKMCTWKVYCGIWWVPMTRVLMALIQVVYMQGLCCREIYDSTAEIRV